MKFFYIMRGIPGSGKSTVAKRITDACKDAVICSADDYFMKDGEYKFDGNHIHRAHESCWMKFRAMVNKGIPVIVLDNTNIKQGDFEGYENHAREQGYTVITTIIEEWDVDKCYDRNTHGVPKSTMQRMKDGFQS